MDNPSKTKVNNDKIIAIKKSCMSLFLYLDRYQCVLENHSCAKSCVFLRESNLGFQIK